jgi:integrase
MVLMGPALSRSFAGQTIPARYQHVTDPIRHAVAAQVGGLLWADEKASEDAN